MQLPEFKNKQLLEEVFTHRSYLNEVKDRKIRSNERLEFLGDSILSFIVSSYIFNEYPDRNEGELTNLRSVLTNTQTFYLVSKALSLGKYLKMSKGEEESGGRENKTILANTFEALVGGIFLDQGIETVKSFTKEALLNNIDEIISKEGLKDPKSTLQEIIQEEHKTSPIYKIIKEEGPDHLKVYTSGVYFKDTLLASGVGYSKQEAEKSAAKNALEKLPSKQLTTR